MDCLIFVLITFLSRLDGAVRTQVQPDGPVAARPDCGKKRQRLVEIIDGS